MFGSSLPPVVCRRAHVLSMLLVCFAYIGVQHVVNIWLTWRVWYKIRTTYHSWVPRFTPVFSVIHVAHLFSFLCYVLFFFVMCLVYLMLPISLDCPFLVVPLVYCNVYKGHMIYVHLFCPNITDTSHYL